MTESLKQFFFLLLQFKMEYSTIVTIVCVLTCLGCFIGGVYAIYESWANSTATVYYKIAAVCMAFVLVTLYYTLRKVMG